MTTLYMERFAYTPTETEGRIWLGTNPDFEIYTLERPWIDSAPGGKPFESCVPDGKYQLVPHTRPNGQRCVALVNPDLNVYYLKQSRPNNVGRYLVLIHSGNFVDDVVGCIAPGIGRTIYNARRMVTDSRNALERIMQRKPTALHIVTTQGAKQ